MKGITKRLKDIFPAVAFTEVAEFDKALELFRWFSLVKNPDGVAVTPAVSEGCP